MRFDRDILCKKTFSKYQISALNSLSYWNSVNWQALLWWLRDCGRPCFRQYDWSAASKWWKIFQLECPFYSCVTVSRLVASLGSTLARALPSEKLAHARNLDSLRCAQPLWAAHTDCLTFLRSSHSVLWRQTPSSGFNHNLTLIDPNKTQIPLITGSKHQKWTKVRLLSVTEPGDLWSDDYVLNFANMRKCKNVIADVCISLICKLRVFTLSDDWILLVETSKCVNIKQWSGKKLPEEVSASTCLFDKTFNDGFCLFIGGEIDC